MDDKMDKINRTASYMIRSERGRRKIEDIFLRAVEQGNSRAVANCLLKGVYPNLFDEDDMGVIHHAAMKGDMVLGEELLDHPQINLNLRTIAGYTPLMLACLCENRKFAKALLARGAEPDLKNDKGQTALHMACVTGHTGMVTDLTGAGAAVNVVDVFDNTPLSIAITDHPMEAIARHLLRKGALSTGVKQFPLLLECVLNCNSKMRLDVLKILLHHNGDVNCLHPISKMNCLHYTGITGYLPAAEYLLTNGANVHQVDRSRRTPLKIAQDHESKDVAKLFRRWVERRKVYFASAENIMVDMYRLYD